MADFLDYLSFRRDHILDLAIEHAQLVLYTIAIATAVSVVVGVLVYRRERLAGIVLSVVGTAFTIPALALFALLIPIFGLGFRPALVALVIYALLPITRNTIAGLRGVDQAVIESAQGMGMNRWRRLIRIELPLAWPVILTGIRVATVMIVGIAAIAAYVNGPGLGHDIFDGLSRIGTPTAIHLVLSGTLGVVALALLFDAAYLVLGKLTTSKGLR
ncbi:MAG: ABC transporter permease [Actinomycetota bacterium]|nr:ABC transporter permease [Actinomycetota bacterium]